MIHKDNLFQGGQNGHFIKSRRINQLRSWYDGNDVFYTSYCHIKLFLDWFTINKIHPLPLIHSANMYEMV